MSTLAPLLILSLLSLFHPGLQNIQNNEVDDDNPIGAGFASIFGGANAGPDDMPDLAGMVSSFMASEGGKNIGNMIMGAATGAGGGQNNNVVAAQILQGIGSLLTQTDNAGGGRGGGIDPSIIGTVISMMGQAGMDQNESNEIDDDGDRPNKAVDLQGLLSVAGAFMNNKDKKGSGIDLMSLLPMLLNTVNSFVGPEAQQRTSDHSDHAWFLPPLVEKFHVMFDHFIHSDVGRSILASLGGENFMKIFSDESGNFSYDKFVELLENQSFRRHWIKMVTSRIAETVQYFSDPGRQKSYLNTAKFIINNFLLGQNIPASAFFDPARPVDSITNLANYIMLKHFDQKVDSRKYVEPAVEYVLDLFKLAEKHGILGRKIDSSELSHKLTDTINLEIIEPIARVNRAYRFIRKVPACDKYVMCLVNSIEPNDEGASLPGLKSALSRGTSMLASWFISMSTKTEYYTLYNIITADNHNCKSRFLDDCEGFHIEEHKVKKEYIHQEL